MSFFPAAAFLLLLSGSPGAGGGEPDFQREIRPLLAERCFTCHGPDAGRRKAKLRLDTFEGATARRAGAAAVVPGRPEESELLARVASDDPEERMPPEPSGKPPLSPAEQELLRRWIEAGARYETHWSFVPPRRAALPEVRAAGWCRDPLDRFVLARLEEAGLGPSPEAAPERFLRRVTFALTGLPPTLAELDAFLADSRRDPEAAYQTAVERLLASPHLGEHLAAGWLDLARYADTYGYQSDVERRVWPWRDWVIAAFDRNLPYAEFVTQQLAGDLLPGASRDERLATAFNRLHRMTNEGGSVEEEFRVEAVADRVNTFGTAFLGLTLECARCHDHKFDPLTTREYHAIGAFFDDIDECGLYSHFTDATPTPTLLLPSPEQERTLEEARAEVRRLEQELEHLRRARTAEPERAAGSAPALPAPAAHYPLDAIEDGQLANAVQAERAGSVHDDPELVPGARGQALRFSGDNGAAFPGVAEFAHWRPFTFAFWLSVPETKARAVVLRRSRAWTDAGSQGYQLLLEEGRLTWALVHFWPGDAVAVRTREPFPLGRFVHVVASYDGSGRAAGLALHLDGLAAELETVRDRLVKGITGGDPGPLAVAERFRDVGLAGGALDELMVFERELSSLEASLLAGRAPSTDPAARRAHAFLVDDPEADGLRARLTEARRRLAETLAGVPEIMAMEDREPRPAFVLRRGRYDDPDRTQPVEPGTPAVLPPLGEGGADRLALARWLTEPGHPLTARVAVNHFWQVVFGRGLVETSEDFGLRGSLPTHPELLDALALDFVASGWDVKALLARLVLSATFRQDSRARAEQERLDPGNALLGRFPARRLAAEELRDQALAASGLLVPTVGGASVRPWQPPGLWSFTAAGTYVPDEGDARHRRSLYTFWKRTAPPPNLTLFDAARREVCVARRTLTSTPQQSLVLLNDPQFVETALALARRCAGAGAEPERITAVFRSLTGRAPEPEERVELAALAASERAAFAADPAACAAWLGAEAAADEELAALALVAATVLTLDASVTLR